MRLGIALSLLLLASAGMAGDAALLRSHAAQLIHDGQVDEALTVLDEALKAAHGDASLEAPVYTAMASAQMLRGDHGTAVATMEKAIARYATLNKPDEEANAWARLAQIYLALGAYDSAGAALEKAEALAKTGNFELPRAMIESVAISAKLAKIGPMSAFLRSFDTQLDLLDGGRLMFDQFWPMFANLIAMTLDPEAVTNAPFADPGNPSLAMMRQMLPLLEGRTLFMKGEIRAAREKWTVGLEGCHSSDLRGAYLASLGATYLKAGNAAEALRWFERAADSVDAPLAGLAVPELMSSYLGSERRWYYDITIETLLRLGRAEEAFDYSERARARAFLQLIGNHRVADHRGSEALVREANSLKAQIERWERGRTATFDELASARKKYETLMVRVRASNPEYASLTTVEPLQVDAVRRELPAGTTLISYYVSSYGVRAWVIDRNALHYAALPLDYAAFERTICWANAFGAGKARGVKAMSHDCARQGSAEEAFALLVAPLREHLRHERLIIVPHGELHYVPFAALRDSRNGRYLIEDFTLTLLPSASALRFLRSKETPVRGGALIIGNPESSLGALPGSEREALAVARGIGTAPMLGTRAAEDLLYNLDGSVDLLHIAAHGIFDSAHPLFSYLALSPGGSRDGKLEVHEILGAVDLTGVNLVVLSACRTAAGERSGGDDVVGLTTAILYAGSPGVISTLWNIDDDASAVLMEELYCRLLHGVLAADALRAAQLTLLHSPAHAHPRFWAAFALTGSPSGRWTNKKPEPFD
ncbi:MAG TPA: CHAT domain-containing protein [Thermoanaerobaculia bacterium]